MFAKEDYVSFKTAKMLKEKSFDELTEGFYDADCKFDTGILNNYNQIISIGDPINGFKTVEAAAPSLYGAQKWLRNKHNIHLCVKCTAYIKRYEGYDYICEILDLSHHQHKNTPIYHSYEQALDMGIQEALRNI